MRGEKIDRAGGVLKYDTPHRWSLVVDLLELLGGVMHGRVAEGILVAKLMILIQLVPVFPQDNAGIRPDDSPTGLGDGP